MYLWKYRGSDVYVVVFLYKILVNSLTLNKISHDSTF